MNLASSTPVRLTKAADEGIKSLQRSTKVNKSTLIRLAVSAGLPLILKQFSTGPQESASQSSGRPAGKVDQEACV